MSPTEVQALQTWVEGELNERYGSVTDERLPDEWLRLIDSRIEG